jgi:arsenate reductase
MAIIFYGLKTCDTCRKAQKQMTAAGKTFDNIDVRAAGISKAQFMHWCEKVDWQKLLNTRSTTWRGLNEDEKSDLDQSQAICLMSDYPTLIKRPVIDVDGDIYVGWTPETKAAIL